MLSTTLAILLIATWCAILVSWLKRMPSGQFCPRCANGTQAIVAPMWLRPMSRWLVVRWCANCDWQSVGRNGPDYIPGKQIAHDSGFLWADDQTGENMGFRWKQTEEPPTISEPPAHSSGFRFGASQTDSGEPAKPKAHPSGFAWGGEEAQAPTNERRSQDHPSGFAWGNRRGDARPRQDKMPPRGTGFEFKDTSEASADEPKKDDDKPGGFKWGGVA